MSHPMDHRPHHPSSSRGAAIAALLCAAPLAVAQPALAEEATTGRAPQPVVVVMDYSGSMLNGDADASGTTRVDAAKAAAKDLVDSAPEGAQLGLVAYGHRREKDCKDIETVQPLGAVDRVALDRRIDALGAHGETPISGALTQAADELKDKAGGKGSIVLVSDGEPSCNTPPACDVAKDLKKQGLDVTVHTVGFRLGGNSKAQETLECIAEATGGTATLAEDAQQLTERLSTQATRALEGYIAAGTRVSGGARYEDAVLLPPGEYTDELTARGIDETMPPLESTAFPGGEVKFYRLPLPEGYSPVISASLPNALEQATDGGAAHVSIEPVKAPGDGTCPANAAGDGESMGLAGGIPTATWADATWLSRMRGDEQLRRECLTPEGDLVVAVHQSGSRSAGTPSAVELFVAYEPLTAPDGAPAPEQSKPAAPAHTEVTQLAGGRSFNDATPLKDGQTVSDSLVPGEQRYYAIDAGTGQDVLARLDLPRSADGAGVVMASLYNPLRERMLLSDDQQTWMSGYALGTMDAAAGTSLYDHLRHSIDPALRLDGVDASAGDTISVPGKQYVVVSRQYDKAAPSTPLPIELTVTATGKARQGGPEFITTAEQYTQRFGAPEDAGSATAAASDGAQAEEGQSGAAPSGSPAASASDASQNATSASPETAADRREDDGVPPWAWLLGGVGLLAVAAGAGLVMSSRRTR